MLVGQHAGCPVDDVFVYHWFGVKLTRIEVCLQTARVRSRRPTRMRAGQSHTAVQCTECPSLEEVVGVRHSASRAECQRPYIRAHAARAYTFAVSLAPPHCHIRTIPRIYDLRRSPNFPLPNTATRVAVASPRRGHFTLSHRSPSPRDPTAQRLM